MRSHLFSSFEVKSEANTQFAKDAQLAMSLPTDIRNSLLHGFATVIEQRDRAVADRILDELAKETRLTVPSIQHVFALITFLLRQLDDKAVQQDTPAQWAADLAELEIIRPEQASAFETWSATIKNQLSPRLHPQARARVTERGLLPFLSSVGATVEMRGVFSSTYQWGDAVENYEPTLESVVPVVSIRLGFDSGFPDAVCFQASMPVIDRLISSLYAARREAEVLQERSRLAD
jgi:hypothetical protein